MWRLPRLGPWAGYAVFDFCTRGTGRYELMRRADPVAGQRGRPADVVQPTGFRFDTQREVYAHLAEHAPIFSLV